jgi:hypothetical protein
MTSPLREELARTLIAARVRAAAPNGIIDLTDVDAMVTALLPMVEAHVPSCPAGHADAAVEAIRALTAATMDGGYEQPSDVDSVVAALEDLTHRLPQVIILTGKWLADQDAAGRIGDDRGGGDTPHLAVAEVHYHLRDATDLATRIAGALNRAHQATSHLTGTAGDGEDPGVTDSVPAATADGDTDEVTAR